MNTIIQAGMEAFLPAANPHAHSCWELSYCVQGSGALLFEETALPCRAGDLIIIPPEVSHSLVSQKEAACICLSLDETTLAFRYPAVMQDNEHQCLLHLCSDAHYLFQSGAESGRALLPSYGQLICQHVISRHPSSPRSLLVDEIARSITQNYTNPNYELDQLLRAAPYCYDYLCRLFRQEMHTTPHKYLMNLRLQSAADILRAGASSSITEIARMCGYHDPLYFSRIFKKKFGLSPREYARESAAE